MNESTSITGHLDGCAEALKRYMRPIARCSMSRATPDATGRCHRATTCFILPHQLPGQQQTKQRCNMYSLWWLFWWPSQCGGTIACTAQWRRFMTFTKATKRHHRASTRSNSIDRTCQHRLFWKFHREKELQVTCWALITIGVWHIKLMRST